MHQYQKDIHLESNLSDCRRLEVLEGPTGRRSWPVDFKLRLVAESQEPGVKVRDVAERNGLRPQHLSTWRRLAREGRLQVPEPADMPGFALVSLDDLTQPEERLRSSSPLPMASHALMEIERDGVTVRIPVSSPAARVAELATVLRSLS